MPRIKQTTKIKVHRGSLEIPSLQTSASSKSGKAAAKTVVKAKIHKRK